MTLSKLAIAGSLLVALGVAVVAGGLAAGMPRTAEPRLPRSQVQEKVGNERPSAPLPSLPAAVTQPPPWLGNDAPFDIDAFFAAPPPEENAAPRYLEALFEFGPQVEVCFPEGADRQSRKNAVEKRLGRFWPVFQSWTKDPASVPATTIDAWYPSSTRAFASSTGLRLGLGACSKRGSEWRAASRTFKLSGTSLESPG